MVVVLAVKLLAIETKRGISLPTEWYIAVITSISESVEESTDHVQQQQ